MKKWAFISEAVHWSENCLRGKTKDFTHLYPKKNLLRILVLVIDNKINYKIRCMYTFNRFFGEIFKVSKNDDSNKNELIGHKWKRILNNKRVNFNDLSRFILIDYYRGRAGKVDCFI